MDKWQLSEPAHVWSGFMGFIDHQGNNESGYGNVYTEDVTTV